MRYTVAYYLRMLIAHLPAYIHLSNVSIHASIHARIHTTHTGTPNNERHISDLIYPDEPPACIFHQMLAPSHRAQVLF